MTWDTIDNSLNIPGAAIVGFTTFSSMYNGKKALLEDGTKRSKTSILQFDTGSDLWTTLGEVADVLCLYVVGYDLNYIIKIEKFDIFCNLCSLTIS